LAHQVAGDEPGHRHPQGITMQDNSMQAAMQPFLKLAQSNMELLMKFSMSPEAMRQSLANAQNLFKQGETSSTTLYGSSAFTELMQGMLKNYTEFMMESAQIAMAVLVQGQAAMARQAEEIGSNVIDAADARGRRNKKA
jgi:hypothetical protein